jgi:hypothetical protein
VPPSPWCLPFYALPRSNIPTPPIFNRPEISHARNRLLNKGKKPESHFTRTLVWLREAGLQELTARTLGGDVHAPLPDDLRSAMIALFQMRWPGVESELAPQDLADYRRLCLPGSQDFIVDHPDYYAFFTYSMFRGKVPA